MSAKENAIKGGIGLLVVFLLIPLLLIVAAAGWYGFAEARKAYWDNEVKKMCARDGNMKVFERTILPKKYVDNDGYIRIPVKPEDGNRKPFRWEAQADDEYFAVIEQTKIKEGQLSVGRYQYQVKRSLDNKTLGLIVLYQRSGGDMPTFISYPSSFVCPAGVNESSLVRAIFLNR